MISSFSLLALYISNVAMYARKGEKKELSNYLSLSLSPLSLCIHMYICTEIPQLISLSALL